MASLEEVGKKLINTLNQHGFEAYIVGGAVRDKLMDRPIRDIDICTNASVEDMKEIFPQTYDMGIKHGTLVILNNGIEIEVSQFKSEKGKGISLKEDLALRDFTCNAMALREDDTIIDPFNGRRDIDAKLLKVVRGSKTFSDDPLRLLRALRFAIQFKFTIDIETEKLIQEHSPLIEKTAVERVASEFEKIASSGIMREQLQILLENDVTTQLEIFPLKDELINLLKGNNLHIHDAIEWWCIASFSRNISESEKILKTFKRSKIIEKNTLIIIKAVLKGMVHPLTSYELFLLGEEGAYITGKLLDFFKSEAHIKYELTKRWNDLPIHRKGELVVSGEDLIKWFSEKPGAWIGQELSQIEQAVVQGYVLNDKVSIHNWLKARYLRGIDDES